MLDAAAIGYLLGRNLGLLPASVSAQTTGLEGCLLAAHQNQVWEQRRKGFWFDSIIISHRWCHNLRPRSARRSCLCTIYVVRDEVKKSRIQRFRIEGDGRIVEPAQKFPSRPGRPSSGGHKIPFATTLLHRKFYPDPRSIPCYSMASPTHWIEWLHSAHFHVPTSFITDL